MQLNKRASRNRIIGQAGLVAGLSAAAGSAMALGPDLSTVTSAVDFGTVTTAILGVAAAVVVVYLAWKGAKMVIAAVRGA